MLYKKIISKKLKKLAKEKFGTQKNMAEDLNFDAGQLSTWINGKVMPSLELLEKIVIKYNLPPEYFFVDDSHEEKIGIDEDLFNQIFELAYSLAIKENLKIKGTYFLGCYEFVIKELNKNPNISVEDIFKQITPLLLKIVR